MKIFMLIGRSSSGKDTIYKRLLKKSELNLRPITSYTTRPIRDGEKDGSEYFFVSEERFQELLEANKLIEHRSYTTVNGVWRYFTVRDNQLTKSNNYLVIGTPRMYETMSGYFGNGVVYPVLIKVDELNCLLRAINREKREPHLNLKEVCRRFIADCDDFSDEALCRLGTNKSFDNIDLNLCVQSITDYIKSIIS